MVMSRRHAAAQPFHLWGDLTAIWQSLTYLPTTGEEAVSHCQDTEHINFCVENNVLIKYICYFTNNMQWVNKDVKAILNEY